MSQMSVIDLNVSYDQCFGPTPSTEKVEDIEAANNKAVIGLNLDDPRLEWKGGIGGGWWTIQTIKLQPETGEWQGTQLTQNEMWWPKAVGLPLPPDFEPSEPFKALDVAAWNNKQLQNLPDWGPR
jgi:hypothetical protein